MDTAVLGTLTRVHARETMEWYAMTDDRCDTMDATSSHSLR